MHQFQIFHWAQKFRASIIWSICCFTIFFRLWLLGVTWSRFNSWLHRAITVWSCSALLLQFVDTFQVSHFFQRDFGPILNRFLEPRHSASKYDGERYLPTQKKGGKWWVLLCCRSLGNAGTLFGKVRRVRICNRIRSVCAHAEQKGFKLRWKGNSS